MKFPFIRPLFDGEELEVSIQGLEIMNDDPGEVDVLYAKVEEQSGRLQVGCQAKACFSVEDQLVSCPGQLNR